MYLLVDQYGQKTILLDISRKTLREKFHAGRIRKQYQDDHDGNTYQTGYVIGQGRNCEPLWLTVYKIEPMRKLEVGYSYGAAPQRTTPGPLKVN